MEKNNQNIEKIDKKVREVLTDLEVPLNANHWNLMNQQLDALDNQETAFDESVRRNMQNTEIPFQPNHWELMNQQLGELDNKRFPFYCIGVIIGGHVWFFRGIRQPCPVFISKAGQRVAYFVNGYFG